MLFACGSAVAAPTAPSAAPQYLFSIPTSSGSLVGSSDKHLTLRLSGARNYLTRFTDRPLRQAFVVANRDFAKRFQGYFADSDPNAVLTYTPRGSQIPVSIVLTIGQPRWNAKRSTWTFSAIRIRKQPDNLPGSHIKPPLIPNPRTFKQATLLIDDTTWVINGCTIAPATSCPNAYLRSANLWHANLNGANLTDAHLTFANLTDAYLPNANLTGAHLDAADLTGAYLPNANLTGADLTADHLYAAYLSGANLTDAYLNADFTYTNLSGTNLTRAYLHRAYLSYTNLSRADLTGADLTSANLRYANLTGANLTGANLTGAWFCETTMPDGTINNSGKVNFGCP